MEELPDDYESRSNRKFKKKSKLIHCSGHDYDFFFERSLQYNGCCFLGRKFPLGAWICPGDDCGFKRLSTVEGRTCYAGNCVCG